MCCSLGNERGGKCQAKMIKIRDMQTVKGGSKNRKVRKIKKHGCNIF